MLACVSDQENLYLRRGILTEFYLGATMIAALLLLFIVSPRTFAPVQEMLDVMIFQKSSSSSFEERSMWTRVSWEALQSTSGLGVGMGGTRASNFAVVLVSSSGILGGLLFFSFVVQCILIRRTNRGDLEGAALMSALKVELYSSLCHRLNRRNYSRFRRFQRFLFGLSVALSWKTFSESQVRTNNFGSADNLVVEARAMTIRVSSAN